MLVFVYGTLKRGHGNYERLLKESKFVKEGETLPDFTMLHLGGFPGIVKGKSVVKGEVFDVDAPTRERLDRLEGHPNFYRRTPIVLKDGTPVEVYVLQRGAKGYPVIESGEWNLVNQNPAGQ